MPRMLALDWTRYEARYVLANSSGEKLAIEAAGAISLADLSDADFANADKLGETIRQGLAGVKVGRANTLLAINRSQAELLEFAVPAVPPAELPGIVLNLAMRESSAVTEESIVDFITAPAAAGDSTQVTVAALASDTFRRIQRTCTAAKLTPQRIVVRPYATAALLPGGSSKRSLLFNRVGEDVDMTVVDAGHVVFSRTVRVPAQQESEAVASRLMQEIRRTMMVAPHGINGGIDAVYLLGQEQELAELLALVRQEFGADRHGGVDDHTADVDVSVFDIFAALGAERELIPENSGSYAALLGLLRTEAQGGGHPFDFLNPRKAPKPPDRKRLFALVGGLAATAALIFGYGLYEDYSKNVEKIDELLAEIKTAKAGEKKMKKQAAIAETISKWEAGGVNWLDELQSFSTRFPSARDAMVLRMALSSSRGGTISFNGMARDPAVVTQMELDLRDGTHDIQTPRVQERVQENGYAWQFDTKINITLPKSSTESDGKTKSAAVGKSDAEPKSAKTEAVKAKSEKKEPKVDAPAAQSSSTKGGDAETADTKSPEEKRPSKTIDKAAAGEAK